MEKNELKQGKASKNNQDGKFWVKKDDNKIQISRTKILEILKNLGIARYDLEEGFTFIRNKDNIIEYLNKTKIIDIFFNEYFEQINFSREEVSKSQVNEALLSGIDKYFSESILARLTTEKPEFIQDTKDKAFLFFQNICIEITKEGTQEFSVIGKPYKELNKCIWKNHILPKSFEYKKIDFTIFEDIKCNVFADFVWFVAKQDMERFLQIASIIGYALHTYPHVKRKAICFVDSSLETDNNGRSGKTLLAKALGKVRAYKELPGKDFKADNKHKYQTCELDTQIVNINDLKANFYFESLYNDITEGISVEKKNQTPFTIQPKIILTSNQPIKTKGGSDRDRIIEYEFSDYFSVKWSPEQEFKKRFFSDWDDNEWNNFYNFFVWCIGVYFTNGLTEPTNANLEIRKLIKESSPDFWEWCEDKEKFWRNAAHSGEVLNRKDLKADFESFAELDQNDVFSDKKFKNVLSKYLNLKGYIMTDKREKQERGKCTISKK